QWRSPSAIQGIVDGAKADDAESGRGIRHRGRGHRRSVPVWPQDQGRDREQLVSAVRPKPQLRLRQQLPRWQPGRGRADDLSRSQAPVSRGAAGHPDPAGRHSPGAQVVTRALAGRTKRIGVDVGGTYTDLVLLDGESGEMRSAKAPSVPRDLSQGVMD